MPQQNRPRCERAWRAVARAAADAQLTCYAPRNPAMPWIAAELVSEQAHADSEEARAWIDSPGTHAPEPYEVNAEHGGG